MSLTLFPASVANGATAIVVYKGMPARRVSWALTGSGNLVSLANMTDQTGHAAARFTPANAGDSVTITVTAGA